MRIFIVDDDLVSLAKVTRVLKKKGYAYVEGCNHVKNAVKKIKENQYDIVLLDVMMPEMDGIQVLEATKSFCPETEFIMFTGVDDVETTMRAVRRGAYDYLVKPITNHKLMLSIERAYERKGLLAGISGSRRDKDHIPEAFSSIITRSPRMLEMVSYANIMAKGCTSILITGETGTGKELMARGIHNASPYSQGPFVPVNVSSIPDSLFESQFFGHVKGAFTHAERDHMGFFEKANGGTLFLDEIGETQLRLQSKLLRAIEEKAIRRIGDTKSVPLDFYVIAATNKDLDKASQGGDFRLDLLYRLNSAHVHLPSLRERMEDVYVIAQHSLRLACRKHNKIISDFSGASMDLLLRKKYPGNVRELIQLVENAVLLADTEEIQPRHLDRRMSAAETLDPHLCSLKEKTEAHIAYVMKHTESDTKKAAKILGISVRQVQRKLLEMKQNSK